MGSLLPCCVSLQVVVARCEVIVAGCGLLWLVVGSSCGRCEVVVAAIMARCEVIVARCEVIVAGCWSLWIIVARSMF